MSGKRFDSTTRDLIELDPAAWLRFMRIPVADPTKVETIDSDVSTVSAGADKVLRVDAVPPWIVHIELQAGHDPRLAERIHRYNALLSYRHELPVRSSVVLLRPEANPSELTGIHEKRLPGEDAYLRFRYDVIRVWEEPVGSILAGGLATLPLVAISNVREMGMVAALNAMSDRLVKEADPTQRAFLLASTWVLMGLHYDDQEVDQFLGGIEMDVLKIRGIEESSTFKAIFNKGEVAGELKGIAKGKAEGKAEGLFEGQVREAREILLRQGTKKLGKPAARVRREIAALENLVQLNGLLDRILDVASWDELLAAGATNE